MQRIETIDELRAATASWREENATIALVPTMGNLHKGHMSLVALAAEKADHVIVSVFVNPTQFGPGEDFETYPRTLDNDARKLKHAGVDIMFTPNANEIYPGGLEGATVVSVPGVSAILEGASRPGHFYGVASVVNRLLNICQPDIAIFGQKDYQQLVILERMVADLKMPVEIIACETQRDDNGLALSSRNSYLADDDKAKAASINSALVALEEQFAAGERDYAKLEQAASEALSAAGLQPDYVAIRTAADLSVPGEADRRLVVLAAARLGDVRLIDNRILVT